MVLQVLTEPLGIEPSLSQPCIPNMAGLSSWHSRTSEFIAACPEAVALSPVREWPFSAGGMMVRIQFDIGSLFDTAPPSRTRPARDGCLLLKYRMLSVMFPLSTESVRRPASTFLLLPSSCLQREFRNAPFHSFKRNYSPSLFTTWISATEPFSHTRRQGKLVSHTVCLLSRSLSSVHFD